MLFADDLLPSNAELQAASCNAKLLAVFLRLGKLFVNKMKCGQHFTSHHFSGISLENVKFYAAYVNIYC